MMPRGRTIMRRRRDDSGARPGQANGHDRSDAWITARLCRLAAESAEGAGLHAVGDQAVGDQGVDSVGSLRPSATTKIRKKSQVVCHER
jgi:hypothetical protein